jgi:redox-sensitive bicupin YhaK (pirin superfamily)
VTVTILRSGDRFTEREKGRMSWHAFSFGPFYDPARVGFGPMVLCDEHLLSDGQGFSTHPHQGVTIVTVPTIGAVRHVDSLGSERVVSPGQVGIFETAGGVTHSEIAAASATRFVQFWLTSDAEEPAYSVEEIVGGLAVGPHRLERVLLAPGEAAEITGGERRFVFVAAGSLLRNSLAEPLSQGDAYLIEDQEPVTVTAATDATLLVWALA